MWLKGFSKRTSIFYERLQLHRKKALKLKKYYKR